MSTKLKAVLAVVAVTGGLFTYSSIAQAGSDNTYVTEARCGGGAQESVAIVTADQPRGRGPGGWAPIPSVTVDQVVPGGDNDLFVITLSSETKLTNASAGDYLEVRIVIDGSPLIVRPLGPNTFLESASITVQNSATWCARLAAGNHNVRAAWQLVDVAPAGVTAQVDDTTLHLEVSD